MDDTGGARRRGASPDFWWRLGGGLMLLRLASALLTVIFMLPVRFDLSFPEGAIIARAMDVAQGRAPYTDWRIWPHGFAPYGPLLYYPLGWIGRAAGLAQEPFDFYVLGRAHSLFFLSGLWGLTGLLAVRAGSRAAAACVGVGLFSSWLWVQEFAMSCRPDSPQVFFSLLALAVAMGGPAKGARGVLAWGCLMASFWYKPSSWGIAVVLTLWTLWTRGSRRDAALSLGGFGAAGLIAALALNWSLDGAFLLNMVGIVDTGWNPWQLIQHRELFPPVQVVTILIGAVAGGLALRASEGGDGRRLLGVAVLLSLGASVLQYMKYGADRNYFLETYALACASCAVLLTRFLDGSSHRPARIAVAGVLLMLALLDTGSELGGLRARLKMARRLWTDLPGIEQAFAPGEEVLTYHPYFALIGRSAPTILDPVQFMVLQDQTQGMAESLLGRIEAREFSAIVIPTGATYLYTDGFMAAMAANYADAGRIGGDRVLRPRQGKAE